MTNKTNSFRDSMAALVLVLLAILLFRGHFIGDSLWIGNPDRLNGELKVLKHYLSGAANGNIAAWNEHEMMGYDSFVLPYTFPNPIVYLVGWFGQENLYVVMGYVVMAMLAAAGLAAYAFIRAELSPGIPALAGAICYEFSSLTILKVSQNSMSFAVFIVIPLLLLVIRHIRWETTAGSFAALAVLLASMLTFMFLQKAAYAVMLSAAYAGWRSLMTRSWRPGLVFCAALAGAVLFSFPRLLGVATAMGEYARVMVGRDLKDFDVLYEFQNIWPQELFRWLDNTIFGASPSDSFAIGNNINLTEGFLLYTSTVVPFLLITGLLRHPWQWTNVFLAPRREAAFFFWVLVACVAVVAFKPVAHALFLLFLRVDFTHARILLCALLPLSLLVALALTDLSPRSELDARSWQATALGLALGILAAVVIELIARNFQGTVEPSDFPRVHHRLTRWGVDFAELPEARRESLARIALSGGLYLALLLPTHSKLPMSLRRVAAVAIGSLLSAQCLLAANDQVNGPNARDAEQPFKRGDFYQADYREFHPPSPAQLRALHARIDPHRYRVALICAPQIADGFCAGHVPEFWQLRTIDGYYGLGVPRRLRALPWPTGVSLRTISFTNLNEMPWALLGLLNVRAVLVASDGVFRNYVRHGQTVRPAEPSEFQIIQSPARITPRAFFAGAVEPVTSAEDAVTRLFVSGAILDPEKTSFVEGLAEARRFEDGGDIKLVSGPDILELRFSASPNERFLVLNDLYYPGWRAEIDGHDLPVLPTNALMRGVLLPPGADRLTFRYQSSSESLSAWLLRCVAALAMLALLVALRRGARP
jgi:hypothetical protein